MNDLITHLPPTFVRWGDRLPWPSVAVTRRAMQLLVRIATSAFAAAAFNDVMRTLITRERVVLCVTQTTPMTTRRWCCAFTRSAPPRQPVVLDQSPLHIDEWFAPVAMPKRSTQPRVWYGVESIPMLVDWDVLNIATRGSKRPMAGAV